MEANNTEDRLKALAQEQDELRLMINEGVKFDVKLKYRRRKPGFFGLFLPREEVEETRVYTIQEPTLKTLDRLSAIWLQLEIDEAKLKDDDYLANAKKLAATNNRKLAEVVAIAVLGEDYYTAVDKGGYFTYREDREELRKLTDTFQHFVKPSDLFTLAVLITNVSNLGDFINSIRLMSATRTSDPTHLIEPQD